MAGTRNRHGHGSGALLLATSAFLMLSSLAKTQSIDNNLPFHSPAPAGYNVVLLQPWRTEVSVLGLVECPEMEGTQKVSQGTKAYLISSEGVPVRYYPRSLSFRVTASLRKILLDRASQSLTTSYDPRQFLLKLGFKLRVYHGLERREIFPHWVRVIGMPADMAYDERVFRVNFDIGTVPASDRLVLEVLSPENELLTHFTFALL